MEKGLCVESVISTEGGVGRVFLCGENWSWICLLYRCICTFVYLYVYMSSVALASLLSLLLHFAQGIASFFFFQSCLLLPLP